MLFFLTFLGQFFTLPYCLVIAMIKKIAMAILVAGAALPLVTAQEGLLVHSGAGLSETMDVLSKKFEDEYGIKVTVNYGGAASLLTQMELKREGDIFIPGGRHTFNRAKEKGFIEGKEKFVAYHIPVIGVPKGNPANITCLEDLKKPGVKVALGDPKAVPIGKKAEKILKKNGIYEEVVKNVVTLELEEPHIVRDVVTQSVGAGIFWRSSIIGAEKHIEIIEIPKEQNAIDVIPIGVLIFSKDKEAARKFMDFVVSEKGVWESNGYVTYPNEKYG
ncbi:molybdate ABC transporter substrate-binding protein, partial [Methanophagales archaeon]